MEKKLTFLRNDFVKIDTEYIMNLLGKVKNDYLTYHLIIEDKIKDGWHFYHILDTGEIRFMEFKE